MSAIARLLCAPNAAELRTKFPADPGDVVVSGDAFKDLNDKVMRTALIMSAEDAYAALEEKPQPIPQVVLLLPSDTTSASLQKWAVFADLIGGEVTELLLGFSTATAGSCAEPLVSAEIEYILKEAGFALGGDENGVRRFVRSPSRREAARMLVSVLENDRKTAVYKVSLLKALTTVAIRTPSCVRFLTPQETLERFEAYKEGFDFTVEELRNYVRIPFAEVPYLLVLEALLEDFWKIWAPDRLAFPSRTDKEIILNAPRQINGDRTPEFAIQLNRLIVKFCGSWEAFRGAMNAETLDAETLDLYVKAVKSIANCMSDGPVRLSGSSLSFAKDAQVVRDIEVPKKGTAPKEARNRLFSVDGKQTTSKTTREALLRHFGKLRLPAQLWAEIRSTAPWLNDSLIMRWSALSSRMSDKALEKTTYPASIADPGLMVARLMAEDPRRDVVVASELIKKLRTTGDIHCIWTGKTLTQAQTAIDHMLPFSKLRSNDLWNLAPVHDQVNNRKRDMIPTAKLLVARKPALQEWWREAEVYSPTLFAAQVRHALPGFPDVTPGNVDLNLVFDGMLAMTDMLARQYQCARWEP